MTLWQGPYPMFAHDLGTAMPGLLFVLMLQEPLLHTNAATRWKKTLWFWGWCVLAIGVPVVLAELGKHCIVWPNHPSFPSGHMTLTAATNIAFIRLRNKAWAALTTPFVVIMFWSLIASKAHTPIDTLAGFVLGTITAWLILWRVRSGNDGLNRVGVAGP
jgi:membrane-associated phospholipid phosphatase